MTIKKIDNSVVEPAEKEEDSLLDLTLRPKILNEYIGQDKIKRSLRIFIEAAKKRKEPIEHILLYGPAGLGKTTLARIIAKEAGVNIRITSGPAIEKVADLGSILTNLSSRDILFIDEIHRMNRLVEEILYPAMEEYVLDIIIGKGPSAKTLRLDLPKFTIIGATTRAGLLSSPLRDRFGISHRLDFYSQEEIEKIILRSSKILEVDIDKEGVKTIAASSRQTPRVANRLLKRVRDFAQVEREGKIDREIAQEALKILDVDQLGLDQVDRKILRSIIEKFDGGPVGLETIAAVLSEEEETIAEVHEPYLLQLGFIQRTPRGRIVTELAYKHLKKKYKGRKQTPLL